MMHISASTAPIRIEQKPLYSQLNAECDKRYNNSLFKYLENPPESLHIAMVVMHARNRQQMAYLLIDILPLFPTVNTEEMEDIQRALNQLNDGAAELRTFDI